MHPLTLAIQFDDEDSVCLALHRDVIEDHRDKYAFADLEKAGFPKEAWDALRLLTHTEGVEYLDYLGKIKANPIAMRDNRMDLRP